jgi:hypothetical protein
MRTPCHTRTAASTNKALQQGRLVPHGKTLSVARQRRGVVQQQSTVHSSVQHPALNHRQALSLSNC